MLVRFKFWIEKDSVIQCVLKRCVSADGLCLHEIVLHNFNLSTSNMTAIDITVTTVANSINMVISYSWCLSVDITNYNYQ